MYFRHIESLLCPALRVGALSDYARLTSVCLTSDVRLSIAYIGPKSRTERPIYRKTKISTEVAHVTRDSDTTFKVKRSKVKLLGAGAYCGGLPHSLFYKKKLASLKQRVRTTWTVTDTELTVVRMPCSILSVQSSIVLLTVLLLTLNCIYKIFTSNFWPWNSKNKECFTSWYASMKRVAVISSASESEFDLYLPQLSQALDTQQ